MPEYLHPGVYLEELPTRMHPIQGVSTSGAGFIGLSPQAAEPTVIASFADFERTFASHASPFLALAVRGFFENGGTSCFVVLAASTNLEAALNSLATRTLSILCCPDEQRFSGAAQSMAAHCEQRKDRMCILHSPQPAIPDASHEAPVRSSYAVYYYPWLTVTGLDGTTEITIPPSGHVAGIYARTNVTSANSSPAGIPLSGVLALSQNIGDSESDLLNSRGIDVLRSFPGKGIVVWGARTTSNDPEWQYVAVRRLLIYVERSIQNGMQWAVFEPNNSALWAQVRVLIEHFLSGLWQTGALQGSKAEEAFFVRCDQTTMTQADLDAGRLIMLIGVAPLRPAEFVILRITCLAQN